MKASGVAGRFCGVRGAGRAGGRGLDLTLGRISRRGRRLPVLGLAAATLAALTLAACNEQNTYVPPPPPQVTAAPVLVEPVGRYLELTGNTAAINAVDLNARVQGFLTQINYQDGQIAQKGSVLFVIEQDVYKADVAQAKATLAANQALQVQAEAEYNRQAQLAKQDFASQATLDQARAKRDQAVANVQNADASLQLAQINLGYTQVVAPFTGVVTAHLQDVGALVGYGGPTKLASVIEVNPIYVWFSLSEQQVLHIKEALRRSGRELMSLREHPEAIAVEIGLQTEVGYPHQGKLDYIAPQVDPNLGTLTVRAVFDNANTALLPGLFTRVRLPLGPATPTVLIPDGAISTNQLGPYVLTVNADGVVAQRQITTGQLQSTGLRAIEGGLTDGDRVIIEGIQRAVPGARVDAQKGVITPVVAAPAAAAPAAATLAPPPAAVPPAAPSPGPPKAGTN